MQKSLCTLSLFAAILLSGVYTAWAQVFEGIPGPPGDTGDTGPLGPSGVIGPNGLTGDSGNTGSTGVVGDPAAPAGVAGPTGPAGLPGPIGNTGATGASGSPGGTGATGATGQMVLDVGNDTTCIGIPGLSGPPGATGVVGGIGAAGYTGYTGYTGATGMTGDIGPPAPPGPPGPTGSVGPVGPAGATGYQGIPGKQGATGATGSRLLIRRKRAIGCPGSKGPKGSSGPVGPVGPPGAFGAQGLKGAPGQPGATGVSAYGATGPPGQPGYFGPTGPQGPQGAQGTRGLPGPPGIIGFTGLIIVNIDSIWPLFGPVAGRTRININSTTTNLTIIRSVYIGEYLATTVITSSNVIVIVTPAVNTTERQFVIALELINGQRLNTSRVFEYRDNPSFTDIQPSSHLLVGGTEVTVSGSNLNSVAEPSLTATVVLTRLNDSQPTTNTTNSPCTTSNATQLLCTMPVINLPQDFVTELQNTTGVINGTTGPGVAVYYGPNGVDRADIYIGLNLDGVTTYNNISAVNNTIKMQYSTPPSLNCLSDDFKFDPKRDDYIEIKGSHLSRGSRLVDFHITVGSGVCVNDALTDNQVTCRPPTQEPQPNNRTFCNTDKLSVDVSKLQSYRGLLPVAQHVPCLDSGAKLSIGNADYHCSCLQYTTSSTDVNIPLIVGLTVGLGGAFLVLCLIVGIILCCVCCRRRKKSQRRGPEVELTTGKRRRNRDVDNGGYSTDLRDITADSYTHTIVRHDDE